MQSTLLIPLSALLIVSAGSFAQGAPKSLPNTPSFQGEVGYSASDAPVDSRVAPPVQVNTQTFTSATRSVITSLRRI